MKSVAIVLASAGYAAAMAKPVPAGAHALAARAAGAPAVQAVSGSAPHSDNKAPVINPSYVEVSDAADDVSEYCFTLTADDENWSFTNQPPWGTNSGTIGSLGGQMCVPTSNSAGGAMFIGPDANPGPGSTKFECFFPTSGTANCDVSLVDGYSLSMDCTASGQTIGGTVDLWSTGQTCPDTSDIGSGICKNDNSYDSAQSDVAAFFQPAVNNGNQYCIWVNCGQDYYFSITSSMSCHISGTAKS